MTWKEFFTSDRGVPWLFTPDGCFLLPMIAMIVVGYCFAAYYLWSLL